MSLSRLPLIGIFMKFAAGLRFRQLFFLTAGLFLLDMLVPDLVPFVDELILGLLTLLFANWKKPRDQKAAAATVHTVDAEVMERRLNKPKR